MSTQPARSSLSRQIWMLARMIRGRICNLLPIDLPMKGAYPTVDAAIASQSSRQMVGHNHKQIVPVDSAAMSTLLSWDYPVLFWLDRLMPGTKRIIDAGGHVGVKYRAWRKILNLAPDYEWIVLDLPAMVEEGRARAAAEDLAALRFESDAARLPPADLFLASGLLQYYPNDLSVLLKQLPTLPRHVIVNKVSVRDGPAFVTLQRVGPSRAPYQIRNREQFIADVLELGYEVVDQWDIPSLAHVVLTHPEMGRSSSLGFYFRMTDAAPPKPADAERRPS